MNAPSSALLTALTLVAPLSAQWIHAPTTSPIGPRAGAAMAAAGGGSVYLFGGDTGAATNPLSNQTWSWSGSDWYLAATATAPSARREAQLVYDSAHAVFVLFGGWTSPLTTGNASDETWQWNGTAWTPIATATTPGGRWKHGACFDGLRNRVVVYGGAANGLPVASAETWEFDGANWAMRTPNHDPGPREDHAMCFHTALGKTLLFGGRDPQTGASGATWVYDGTDWTQLAVAGPGARFGAGLVYDPNRGTAILTGGVDANGVPLDETWEFDGTTWTAQPTSATGGRDFGFAFDLARQRAVRMGGQGDPGATWLYGAYIDGIGTSCLGSAGAPFLTSQPARLGAGFTTFLHNLPALSLGVIVMSLTQLPPTPLDGLGLPGCFAYVTPDLLLTAAGSGGQASWNGTVPQDLTMLGASLYLQGLSIDPGFNPAWLVTTNAMLLFLGH